MLLLRFSMLLRGKMSLWPFFETGGNIPFSTNCKFLAGGPNLVFPFSASNKLPLMHPAQPVSAGVSFTDLGSLFDPEPLSAFLSVVSETNQNLTPPMRELLSRHWRLGHARSHPFSKSDSGGGSFYWSIFRCRYPIFNHNPWRQLRGDHLCKFGTR
jgi:hypothetical protein